MAGFEDGTVAGERASSSPPLFQPLQPNAVIIDPLDSAVQLPLDPVEAVGMLIEDTAVLTELRLDRIKSTSDAQKPFPYFPLEGLEPVRHHRSELIHSHSLTRHRSPHSRTGMPALNSSCQVRREDPQFEAEPHARASSTIFEPWLETMDDLRTALLKDPLPVEAMKELLAA